MFKVQPIRTNLENCICITYTLTHGKGVRCVSGRGARLTRSDLDYSASLVEEKEKVALLSGLLDTEVMNKF